MILEFYLTITIPLIYLLGLIIISPSIFAVPYTLYSLIGLIFTILGLVLWIWSYLSLGLSLTVLPKAQKLVTTGPYKYFSHPIYLAIILTFFGLSLASGSVPGLLYTIVIIIPLNIIRAKKEEKTLLKKFGKEYEAYKKKALL